MSYDITIVDKDTKESLFVETQHDISGGTYAVGGTKELWMNITYNYAPFFREVFKEHGERGIHCLDGMPVAETMSWIDNAIGQLKEDVTLNYWEPTEGNAKASLICLYRLAELGKDGIWEIDG